MALSYHSGGVVRRVQDLRAMQQAGTAGLREEVEMAFPVISAYYSDAEVDSATMTNLQMELFDGPWDTPTMAEHYAEMSYGQFHLSGQVYGWYPLANDGAYYEGSQSEPYDNGFFGPPGGVADFLQESLTLSDPDIDFALYDSDGPDGIPNSGDDDGYVDATFFVHSGRGGEGGGPYIWSHRWRYSAMWGSAFVTDDASANGGFIRVNDYIMQPAASTGGGMIEIGVFSHEFGHALGLPDLYDTDYSSDGIGDWCLMGGGSWNSPTHPAHLSAWCKEMLGWVTPVLPDSNILAFEIPNVEENPFVLKLWTHGDVGSFEGPYSHGQDVGMEYFLIENRQRLGTDIHLTNIGLMIWHIDNSQYTNSNDWHRMVEIKGADGLPGNGDSPGDPFPGSEENYNFDFQTIPSATGWAGTNTEVAVLNISGSDTTMTADVEVHESVPHFSIVDFIVLDMSADQILEAGEAAEVWIEVHNVGGPATEVSAILTSLSPLVEVTDETLDIEDLGFMGSALSNSPFEFIVGDIDAPHVVGFKVNVLAAENSVGDSAVFHVGIGPPEVAIVDADGVVEGESNYLNYYSEALDSLMKVYQVWDIADLGVPDADWLMARPKLIWYSGDADTPLDFNSIALLEDYLDNGGNLLLSGQHMSNGGTLQEEFLAEYLGAEVMESSVDRTWVYGNSEHAAMTDLNRYLLRAMTSASNQTDPDVLHTLDHAEVIFTYPMFHDQTAGTSVITDSYRSIFMGFGFEALAPMQGDAVLARAQLLSQIFDWFDDPTLGVDPHRQLPPRTAEIGRAYPNPFNPSISLEILTNGSGRNMVMIHDIQGRQVAELEVAGDGLLEWRPDPKLSGGIYFARLQQDGRSVGDWKKITYLK